MTLERKWCLQVLVWEMLASTLWILFHILVVCKLSKWRKRKLILFATEMIVLNLRNPGIIFIYHKGKVITHGWKPDNKDKIRGNTATNWKWFSDCLCLREAVSVTPYFFKILVSTIFSIGQVKYLFYPLHSWCTLYTNSASYSWSGCGLWSQKTVIWG